MKYISKSSDQTKKIASDISKKFINGGVLTLSGDLGAGKTTFAQGFAQGLGIKDKIISPTFILMKSYGIFYHIDLYRLEDVRLEQLGLDEIIQNPKNIVLIEWPERFKEKLIGASEVSIKALDENTREILLSFSSIEN